MLRTLVLALIFSRRHLLPTCAQLCEPEDEFPNNSTTTEWTHFMTTLDGMFSGNYTQQCKRDEVKEVVIDNSTDFLWDLRFALYSDSKDGKTVNSCFDQFKGDKACNKGGFQGCMKSARVAMAEVVDTWSDKIDKELARLAENC